MPALPLVITPGEPAGIGTEITLKAWQAGRNGICLIGDPDHIVRTAQSLGIECNFYEISSPSLYDYDTSALAIVPITWHKKPIDGHPDPVNAPVVIEAIRQAVLWTQSGIAAGIVTNPIQKSCLYNSGFAFPGHTEYLSSLAKTLPGGPLMMLACDKLRVVPATIHIPLSEVPNCITTSLIIKKCILINDCLRTGFGIQNPRIAVCGLNPHAGENGQIGREDNQVIKPAIQQLVATGINVTGPHSADALFHDQARKTYDAVLGMYHDQVLIPLKTIDFFGGVNITLGLDFVRTSPDHGTGLDIAGNNVAHSGSMIAAINMAQKLAQNSRRHSNTL